MTNGRPTVRAAIVPAVCFRASYGIWAWERLRMAARWRFVIAALSLIAPGFACAADLPQPAPAPAPVAYTPPVPDWIVTVGLEGRILPAPPAPPDSKLAFTGLPLISVRHAGEPPPYFGPRDSFGFDVI